MLNILIGVQIQSIFSVVNHTVTTSTSLLIVYIGYRLRIKEPSSGQTETISEKLHTFWKAEYLPLLYNCEYSEYIKM
jgi:hypothetical protein